MSYYNTTNETGATLKKSNEKAMTQEKLIFKIFREHKSLTASQCWKYYGTVLTPITSIRRGISNLCSEGKLKRTEGKRIGLYGKSEHIYQLIEKIDSNGQMSLC